MPEDKRIKAGDRTGSTCAAGVDRVVLTTRPMKLNTSSGVVGDYVAIMLGDVVYMAQTWRCYLLPAKTIPMQRGRHHLPACARRRAGASQLNWHARRSRQYPPRTTSTMAARVEGLLVSSAAAAHLVLRRARAAAAEGDDDDRPACMASAWCCGIWSALRPVLVTARCVRLVRRRVMARPSCRKQAGAIGGPSSALALGEKVGEVARKRQHQKPIFPQPPLRI